MMTVLRFPGGIAATITVSAGCAIEIAGTNASTTNIMNTIDVNIIFIINTLSFEVYN
jgi:hypothetical protein